MVRGRSRGAEFQGGQGELRVGCDSPALGLGGMYPPNRITWSPPRESPMEPPPQSCPQPPPRPTQSPRPEVALRTPPPPVGGASGQRFVGRGGVVGIEMALQCGCMLPHFAALPRSRTATTSSAHTNWDSRSSQELHATLYADGAVTEAWMPEMSHIDFQADEVRMCGKFNPSHFVTKPSHVLMQGGCPIMSYGWCTRFAANPTQSCLHIWRTSTKWRLHMTSSKP